MKNFLVTTPIKEGYNKSEKNILLGHWCLVDKKESKKKNNIINYHWADKKKFKKDTFYIKKTTEKIIKILSKKLNKIHNLKENNNYWGLIIYPWVFHYVSSIYDRWETIRIFLKSNRSKVYYTYQLEIKENYLIPKNHNDFINNTFTDEWNHLIFLRIIKYLKPKKINLIKKNYRNSKIKNLEDKYGHPYSKKKNIFYYLILIYEFIISKFAFKFNKIIFESFSFPKKEFLKILIKNLLIPSLYSNLFKDIDLIEDLDFKNREKKLKVFERNSKSKDKFFNFLNESLINDLPMSYIENFSRIRKKMLVLANKKKVIFSMRSWQYNDQFKICMAELVKKRSKYFICDHGGGLVGEYTHIPNYINKFARHIRYDANIKQLKNQKSFMLSPTISTTNKKEIETKKNNRLNITFLEGVKYSNKHTPSAKAQEGIKQIEEIIKFIDCLPQKIKKNTILRSKKPYTLNIKEIFIEKFGKNKFNEHTDQNFYEFAKSSKLMIVNYPQTAFSESMYLNVPTILVCNKKFWFFKKKSLKMFELFKKNKMAFEDFKDAEKYIVKHWGEIYNWWHSKKIQEIRKLYLKNFFNVEKNWLYKWSKFIANQKKF